MVGLFFGGKTREKGLKTVHNGFGDDFENNIAYSDGPKITRDIDIMLLGDESNEGQIKGFEEVTYPPGVFNNR